MPVDTYFLRHTQAELEAVGATWPKKAPPPAWFPDAGSWVSVDGDQPEMVAEVHFDDGVVKLSSGRWVASSHCVAAPCGICHRIAIGGRVLHWTWCPRDRC